MESSKEDKKLQEIKVKFKTAIEAFTEERRLAIEDLEFAYGGDDKQWNAEAKEARKGRPMLTINKLPKFIRQVTGDQRQNRPSCKVRPVDSQADPQIAKILEGHIRNIEYNSNAGFSYDNGFKQAVAGGYPGWWRIDTEYAEDDTFDQDIVINPVHNQFTVYPDPETLSDVYRGKLSWCFVTETLSEDVFKERYPKVEGATEWEQGEGEAEEGWYMDGEYRIAEFWERVPVTKTLYLLDNGNTVEAKDVEQFVVEQEDGKYLSAPETGLPPNKIIRERKAEGHKICWYLVCGNKILEGPKDVAGKFIRLIPVFGDTWVVEGKIHFKSLIRDSKDSMRVYNYMISQNVEMTALAPKVPWILTPKQIQGHEGHWNTIHNTTRPYALYNHDPNGASKPTREPGVQTNTAYIQLGMQATEDLKETTGIFDASLGQKSNEQSGRAILARQREGDIGTFEFIDNLTRAIQYTGKILVDLIPKIYDTERTIRLLGVDDTPQQVQINQEMTGPDGKKVIINDITAGKYDVVATAGPSYTTQRMEAAEGMQAALQSAPNAAPVLLPRWFKMMDWPDSEEISKELGQLLAPPQGPPPAPPISASVAIDLSALRPDAADALIAKVLESGQIKANFKEQPTPAGNIAGGQPSQTGGLTPQEMQAGGWNNPCQ
jgi:hypothetical protein